MRLPMHTLYGLAGALGLAMATGSHAQERTPVQQELAAARFTLISPFPAGGPTDVLARAIAEGLTARYAQPSVVENLTGAAGVIGMNRVKRAKPDGHTLLVIPAGNMTINPSLMANFSFNIQRDFTPITMLAKAPNVLVVNSNAGIDSVQSLIAQAKAKPEAFSYASPGFGSGLHLAGELFKHSAGIEILHVAYRGSAPAMNEVLGGVLPMMFSNLPAALPYMNTGKLTALATTSAQRSALVPDIPTLQELGLIGIDVTSWYGLFGPAGMAPELADQLARDAADVLAQTAITELLTLQGMTSAAMTPAEFAREIEAETAVWADTIKARSIVAD